MRKTRKGGAGALPSCGVANTKVAEGKLLGETLAIAKDSERKRAGETSTTVRASSNSFRYLFAALSERKV